MILGMQPCVAFTVFLLAAGLMEKEKSWLLTVIGLGFSITVIYFVVELFSISPANGFVRIGISLVVTLICLAQLIAPKEKRQTFEKKLRQKTSRQYKIVGMFFYLIAKKLIALCHLGKRNNFDFIGMPGRAESNVTCFAHLLHFFNCRL